MRSSVMTIYAIAGNAFRSKKNRISTRNLTHFALHAMVRLAMNFNFVDSKSKLYGNYTQNSTTTPSICQPSQTIVQLDK